MPPIERSDLKQKAVLWSWNGSYDKFGTPILSAPVEISVRWEWRQSRKMDPKGQEILLDATVMTAQEVPLESQMWLGRLVDWYGTGSGDSDPVVCLVKTIAITPDIKNRHTRYQLGLSRAKASAPVVG